MLLRLHHTAIVLLLASLFWAHPAVAKTVPDVPFLSYERGEVKLSDYRGKVLIVNFWATWCGPCVAEMPPLHDLYIKYRGEGLVVLPISADFNGFDAVLPFLGKHRLVEFEAFWDKRNRLMKAFGVGGSLPATFIIDRQGNIVVEGEGFIDWTEPEVIDTVEKILRQ